jgi:hypothetical protein
MADFHYGGTDEESAEIKKLNAEIVCFIHLIATILDELS